MAFKLTVNLVPTDSLPLLPIPNVGEDRMTSDPSSLDLNTGDFGVHMTTLAACINCVSSNIMTFALCLRNKSCEEIKEAIAGIQEFQDNLRLSVSPPTGVDGMIVTIYLVVQNPDEIFSYLENESYFNPTKCFSRSKTQPSPPFVRFFGELLGLN
jgi:hypothetical protein